MNATRTLISIALGILALSVPLGRANAAEEPVFLRGDVNADGKLSNSDALMFRRFYHNGDPAPSCLDAADTNDDGKIDLFDMIAIINRVFLGGADLAAPFPGTGADPTPDDGVDCGGYQVEPAVVTEDLLRIGDVNAEPGQAVEIPVYLKNSVEVEALQMALEYDPSVLKFRRPYFDFTGSPWKRAFDWEQNDPDPDGPGGTDSPFQLLRVYPDRLVILGLIPHLQATGFELSPGPEEKLIFKILGTILPDAPRGASSLLKPTNGPDGEGVQPPLYLRNELTHRGEARYASLLPRTQAGVLHIVDDITPFVRGDANWDRVVDVSDVSFLLTYQFLGGTVPRCLDAADSDDSGAIELTDAVAILDQLFMGRASISSPYPLEGKDATFDDLAPCR